MKRNFNKIIYIFLSILMTCLLLSSIFVKVFSNSNINTAQLSYSIYTNLKEYQSFHDNFQEYVGFNFESLTIANSGMITYDDDGNIKSLDVSTLGKKDNKTFSINIQLTEGEYFFWISETNIEINYEQIFLSDVLLASNCYSTNLIENATTNIYFIDETIKSLNEGDMIYDGNGLVVVEKVTSGSFAPLSFYNQNKSINDYVYIKRR